MSLKNFFSKKEDKIKSKPSKIGIGSNKNKNLPNAYKDNIFAEDDFKKESETQEADLPGVQPNETSDIAINLETDNSDYSSTFTNKFDNVEDFEDKLNELSSPKKESDLNFSDLSFDINTDKPKDSKGDNFNLEDSVLDDEFKKYSLNEVEETSLNNKEIKKTVNYENELSLKFNKTNASNNQQLPKSTDLEIDNLNASGALANEEAKEEIQEKLNELSSITTTTTSGDTVSSWDIDAPSLPFIERHSANISNDSLEQLDSNLDSQLLTPDYLLNNTTSNNKNGASSQKKRYKSVKKEQYKKSIFGNMSTKAQYIMFCTTLFAGIAGLGGSVFFSYDANNKELRASKLTASMGSEAEQFNSNFRESLLGVTGSYKKMSDTWENILALNKALKDSTNNLKNQEINEIFEKITNNISEVSKNVEYVKKLEAIVKDASVEKNAIEEKITALVELTDRLALIYMQTDANQADLAQINLIKNSLKNINSFVSSILIGESVNPSSIIELNATKEIIQNTSVEILHGSASKGINKLPSVATPVYNKFVNDWKYLAGELDEILKNTDSLTKAKAITKKNTLMLNNLVSDIKVLSELYNGHAHGFSPIFKKVLLISILLIIISLLGLGYVYRFESEKKERALKEESERNKKSVNKLLNEMVYLQTGNLTKKTTVEEGITLDIADSINATIDSLVVVVTKIKNSSLVMKQKTNEINLVSTKLLKATEKQSDSIVEANESINNIAKAIHHISEKTKESLITAQHSSEASNLGARQVKESIESMNAISKNMEETLLLMKKVSDSSKQISEVINLLSDITEETNILALNAAVQAAKAGEAGKGFKVVADSIQELADNAAEATRRVGALVATVQTDIQSVGSSIEKTNHEVERGVELSESAGQSLNEITHISNKLAEIVRSISYDANINAEAAIKISDSMSAILEITEETKESTKNTTNSIAEIDKMSSDLSQSVKTFIVP